jgi:NADPH:quinone reductase-like Zn-dependent oxidoreductase
MRALSYKIPTHKSAIPVLTQVEIPLPHVKEGLVLVRVSYAGLSNFELETSRGDRVVGYTNIMRVPFFMLTMWR